MQCPFCEAPSSTIIETPTPNTEIHICDYCNKEWEVYEPYKTKPKTNDAGELLQSTEATLEERGNRYGPYTEHAKIAQGMKTIMYNTTSWEDCKPYQKQALEMFADKIARILNGDPHYDDSWRDISGYAELVVKELTSNAQPTKYLKK